MQGRDNDGKPEFMAADVCRVLGYSESTIKSSLINLNEHVPAEWRYRPRMSIPSGNRHGAILREVETWFLKLEGINFLVNRSDKTNALPFQKWVNGAGLSAIFKTGRNQIGPPQNPPPCSWLTFSYNGNRVRTTTTEGSGVMFQGGYVCKILGYANTRDALRHYHKHTNLFRPSKILGLKLNHRGEYFFPESDLCHLLA